ncbi:NAD(P)-dependent oxidoreductase [Flammeovirga sp. EKP202]|uniref:NAD-dependent epimerase/dehydratase family protein n=1 Tax=Flammeovirga sp. EKP202 TaxID=2770592 RepID=UPI00165FC910|nr:NAD(P)-dependent oxidoreductase [Flammeovirga sp. EKP202]MBD0400830.1 NAD(P)-dependent oxidoreductase [Flammeovirga sp. EKP202]
MKLIFIGGSSFLAEKILEQLSIIDVDEVCIYTRTQKDWMYNSITEGSTLREPKYTIKFFDALQGNVNDWIEEWSKSDVIINTMAAGVQPKKQAVASDILEINAFFTIQLIEALTTSGFKGKLLTFGSYFEIGDTSSEALLTEEEFIFSSNKLPNTYCLSKKTLTQFVYNKHRSHDFEYDHLHLILTNIYGLGENENRLFPYIVQSVKEGEELKFSSGLQMRQFTHISDVANLVIDLATSPLKHHGVYNITYDEVFSVKEVISKMLSQLEAYGYALPKYEFGEISKRDQSMKFLGISSQKAKKELNWQPKITLEEGLKEYYENN